MDFTKEEIDATPLSEAFSFTRERERALQGLRGILAGVVADRKLNEKELLYLDSWLTSQQHLAGDEVVLGILNQVGEILEDGQISPAELTHMEGVVESLVAEAASEQESAVSPMQELAGFLTGVASDGVLNDEEVDSLNNWLNANAAIKRQWPVTLIVRRLRKVVRAGFIADDMRKDLLKTIARITGSDPNDRLSYQASINVWEDRLEAVKVRGKMFCLTGEFVSESRDSMAARLQEMGADISPNVHRNVDYLVIGTLASLDWLYGSHGRKIEKALLLKRDGYDIKVVTERSLLKYL